MQKAIDKRNSNNRVYQTRRQFYFLNKLSWSNTKPSGVPIHKTKFCERES
jgi:hypothetical protein